jgi:SAM-dependent MidA family methyltransferase
VPADTTAYLQLASQAQKLLSPAEMGELFKVLALGKYYDAPLLGFARGDRSRTL